MLTDHTLAIVFLLTCQYADISQINAKKINILYSCLILKCSVGTINKKYRSKHKSLSLRK